MVFATEPDSSGKKVVSRDPFIDAVRGVAILLVIWGHLIQNSMAPHGGDFFLNPIFRFIYMFHMPLFIFISGYVTALSLQRRSDGSFFKERFRGLMIPYLVWSVPVVLVASKGLGQSLGDVAFNLMIAQPKIWFLATLFFLSILILAARRYGKGYQGWALSAVYVLVLLVPLNQWLGWYYVQWFFPFFIAGYGALRLSANWSFQLGRKRVFLLLGAALIVAAIFWKESDYVYVHRMQIFSGDVFSYLGKMIFRYAAGFVGILWICSLVRLLDGDPVQKVLVRLGVFAFDIYVLQMCLVEGIYPILVQRTGWWTDSLSLGGLMILAPFLAFGVAYGSMMLSEHGIRKSRLAVFLLLGGRFASSVHNGKAGQGSA